VTSSANLLQRHHKTMKKSLIFLPSLSPEWKVHEIFFRSIDYYSIQGRRHGVVCRYCLLFCTSSADELSSLSKIFSLNKTSEPMKRFAQRYRIDFLQKLGSSANMHQLLIMQSAGCFVSGIDSSHQYHHALLGI
jgi:hypothetical protein